VEGHAEAESIPEARQKQEKKGRAGGLADASFKATGLSLYQTLETADDYQAGGKYCMKLTEYS
jgi:hypothetical protein